MQSSSMYDDNTVDLSAKRSQINVQNAIDKEVFESSNEFDGTKATNDLMLTNQKPLSLNSGLSMNFATNRDHSKSEFDKYRLAPYNNKYEVS